MKEKGDSNNGIGHQQLRAFKPIAFAVFNNGVDDKNGEDNRRQFKDINQFMKELKDLLSKRA